MTFCNCHPETGNYRFLSPFETALALVNTDSLILPEDVKVAARMVGNAISVRHAAIVLCQCINVYAQAAIVSHLNPETCIARLLLRKITQFNANVSPYAQGWIILDQSAPPATPGQEQPHSLCFQLTDCVTNPAVQECRRDYMRHRATDSVLLTPILCALFCPWRLLGTFLKLANWPAC